MTRARVDGEPRTRVPAQLERVDAQQAPATAAPIAAPTKVSRGDVRTGREVHAQTRLTDAGQLATATFGARSSSMVALRVDAGRIERIDGSDKAASGEVVLSAVLRDPKTGAPPSLDTVATDMLALLKSGLPKAGRDVLDQVAREPREAYYVLTYDQGSGALALKRVATGDDRKVEVGVAQLRAAVGDGETLLGGLHNHPNRTRARASNADRTANAAMQSLAPGYQDFVLARGKGERPSITAVKSSPVDARSAKFQDAVVEYQAFFKKNPKHDAGVRGGFISDGPDDVTGSKLLDEAVDQGGGSARKLALDGDRFVVFDETNAHTGEYHGHYRDWDELNDKQKSALMKAGVVDRKGRPK